MKSAAFSGRCWKMSKVYSELWMKAEDALSDPAFSRRAEEVLEACYVEQVFPTLRANLNGHRHLRIAATLLLLSESEESVRIDTRNLAKWNALGMPSIALQAVDRLASAGFLVVTEGEIATTDRLTEVIND